MSFNDFQNFILKYLPDTPAERQAIRRAYYYEHWTTEEQAKHYLILNEILHQAIELYPDFPKMKKQEQIKIMNSILQYHQQTA